LQDVHTIPFILQGSGLRVDDLEMSIDTTFAAISQSRNDSSAGVVACRERLLFLEKQDRIVALALLLNRRTLFLAARSTARRSSGQRKRANAKRRQKIPTNLSGTCENSQHPCWKPVFPSALRLRFARLQVDEAPSDPHDRIHQGSAGGARWQRTR
jgi:hypothetical protein